MRKIQFLNCHKLKMRRDVFSPLEHILVNERVSEFVVLEDGALSNVNSDKIDDICDFFGWNIEECKTANAEFERDKYTGPEW
jgi:hypothetical protein